MKRGIENVTKTMFHNGLTLITERIPGSWSLSMGVWVATGSRYEAAHESGISHFLEHMLFKGTENRTALEIAQAIDDVGGEFNAFTTREYTCFHLLLLNKDLALGAEILSDIVLFSTFDAVELERERKVILQEIAMLEENPEELVFDLFFERIFGRHGLGRQILGTEASIRRLARGDLLRYLRRHYRPEQIVISVVGDVSRVAISRAFRGLARRRIWPSRPPRPKTRRELGFAPVPRMKEGRWWVERPTEQVHVVLGYESCRYGSRDRFATYLLNTFLGGGMSSLLFQEIREKNGLAYSVYSTLFSYVDGGTFTVYFATNAKQVPAAMKLVDETLAWLRKDLLEEERLWRVKESLKGALILAAEGAESRMTAIANNELYFGRSVTNEEICDEIDRVTSRDIRRLARKMFGQGRKSAIFMGPRPSASIRERLKSHSGRLILIRA